MISAISPSVPSPAMARVHDELSRLQKSPCTPALLVGATGSGKQHTAERLHRLSHDGHDAAPFVTVDCAALPREFLDSELFGHERGAFPDATVARRGLVELAHGGTLFLHEVTALPLAAQSMLLKFLDGMRLRRLGAQHEVALSLRVVATASQEPLEAVKNGRFHEGLYRRLAVFRVNLPSLHERDDEILALGEQFIEEFSARMHKAVTGFSAEAQALLMGYTYPGNVRELRGIVERAVLNVMGPLITGGDLQLADGSWRMTPPPTRFFQIDAPSDGVPPSLEAVERAYVRRVLDHTGGKRMAAAHLLGISYPTFLKRLRELDIEKPERAVRPFSSDHELSRQKRSPLARAALRPSPRSGRGS